MRIVVTSYDGAYPYAAYLYRGLGFGMFWTELGFGDTPEQAVTRVKNKYMETRKRVNYRKSFKWNPKEEN